MSKSIYTKIKIHAKELKSAFNKKRSHTIKNIYHACLNDLVLDYDENIFDLCLISYMLNKMISKPRYWRSNSIKKYLKQIDSALNLIIRYTNKKDDRRIKNNIKKILTLVNTLDSNDKKHVNNLIKNGSIKISATLYAKGLSLGRVSEVTGINKQDILQYTGKTRMADRIKESMTIKERFEKLEKSLR